MTSSPHDALFKEAFGNPQNARAELQSILPSGLLAHIELDSLSVVPGSFRDENLAGSSSDLLFSARIAGKPALLYVLFEHKSTAERWVGLQLLRYMLRIWDRCLATSPRPAHLPPIVPVLVHHSRRGWKCPDRFEALIDPIVQSVPELSRLTPKFEFVVDDLSHVSDAELRKRALSAFGMLALLFLRDARSPKRLLPALSRWSDLFEQLLRTPDSARALALLFRYLSLVAQHLDPDALRRAVRNSIPQAENTIMTLAEQWIHEGLQRGLQQGQRELLVELLRTKFGVLSPRCLERLQAADESALKRYGLRLLTAETIDEVFAD